MFCLCCAACLEGQVARQARAELNNPFCGIYVLVSYSGAVDYHALMFAVPAASDRGSACLRVQTRLRDATVENKLTLQISQNCK